MDKEGKRLVFEFVPRSPHRINHEKIVGLCKGASGCIFEGDSGSFSVGLTTIWNALHHLGVKLKKQKIYREADPEKRNTQLGVVLK